jgi:membrane protease YdiL (CAAX protease family)
MDPLRITIIFVVIIVIIVATLFFLPVIVAGFTEPKWAIGKSAIECITWMLVLSIFLPTFISVPGGFTIALFRHRTRVARYALRREQESASATVTPPSSAT